MLVVEDDTINLCSFFAFKKFIDVMIRIYYEKQSNKHIDLYQLVLVSRLEWDQTEYA